MDKEKNTLLLETKVTKQKIELAEQVYRETIIKNGLALNSHNIENKKINLTSVLKKIIGIPLSVFAIFFIFYSWIYPQEFCSTVDYLWDTLYLLFFFSVLFIFTKEKSFLKSLAKKIIPIVGSKSSKTSFKDIKNDYLPLTASYSFSDYSITYTKKQKELEKLVWKKSLRDCEYFVTKHMVLFYNDKDIYPQFILFVEDDNIKPLIDYFNSIGLNKPLQLETRVTEEKLKLAEQEYLVASVQNALDFETLRIAKINSDGEYKTFKHGLITAMAILMLIVLIMLIDSIQHGETYSRINMLMTIIAIFAIFIFILKDTISKKFMQWWIPFTCHKNANSIFRNLKNDDLPLIVSYELDETKITYKRKINNSENLIWKTQLKQFHYFTTNNTLMIYKPKAFFPSYLIFIDETNAHLLVNHLKHIRVSRLPLPL